MSHYCLFVVTDGQPTEEELNVLLLPYHEFECTGTDEYVQDLDITAKLREEYENGRRTMIQAPDGTLMNAYDDAFYRDPTEEEAHKIGPLAGIGFAGGLAYDSRDWGDGRGYRTKVQFIPDGYQEVKAPFTNLLTFLEYASEQHGEEKVLKPGETLDLTAQHKYGWIEVNEAGEVAKVVRRTNPNNKWDWWSIGGRYAARLAPDYDVEKDEDNYETCLICGGSGRRLPAPMTIETIRLKHPELKLSPRENDPSVMLFLPDEIKVEYGIGEDGRTECNGCAGKGQRIKFPSDFKNIGNQARWGDIDRPALIEKKRRQLGEAWDEAEKRFQQVVERHFPEYEEGFGPTLRTYEAAMAELRATYKDGDPPLWKKIEADPYLTKLRNLVGFADDIYGIERAYSRDDFLDLAPQRILTCFAILKDGKWIAEGEMGWWAIVTDGQEDWATTRTKVLDTIRPDQWVTVVDCHI